MIEVLLERRDAVTLKPALELCVASLELQCTEPIGRTGRAVWQAAPGTIAPTSCGSSIRSERRCACSLWCGPFGPDSAQAIKILSDAGIDSLRKVANAKPRQLEMVRLIQLRLSRSEVPVPQILNRQPPYGTKLASQARSFPSLRIETSDWQETPTDDGNLCSANVTVSLDNDEVAQIKTSYAQITVFTATSDGQWIDFRRMRCVRTYDM